VASSSLRAIQSACGHCCSPNCDVDENNPPPNFLPAVALAKKGLFAEKFIAPQLEDKQLARSAKGIGQAYTYPERLSDETIEIYFKPLVRSALRRHSSTNMPSPWVQMSLSPYAKI